MKNSRTLILTLVALSFCASIQAQKNNQHFTGSQAANVCKGAKQLTINEKRNTISFIRLQETQNISETNSKDWLKKDVLKARADDNLIQYKQFNDKIGMSHIRNRQHYKGVPVEYGVYYVHSMAGKVQSANGEWYEGINISVTPSLNAKQAYDNACKYMNAKTWWHAEEEVDNNKLMILPVDDEYKLIYKCDVSSLVPRDRQWIYVDAQNGSIVKTESRIHHTDVEGTA
ncbi:MAG: hypothetical protein LH473_06180, partial [Chitinophagales bacterium]|nr:hypothetical protein [Chitinophagales bacterium]